MSILNPTPQETKDAYDKIRTYREYWNPTMDDYLARFKEQEKQQIEQEQKLTATKMLEKTMDDYVKTKHKTFVVAGNYAEYVDWIKRKGYSRTEYIYVYNVDNIRGISHEDLKGIYIGSWRRRPDIEEIRQQISIIKSKLNWNSTTITPVTGSIVTGQNGTAVYYDGLPYTISETIGGSSATTEEIIRDEVRSKIRVDLRDKLQFEIDKMMPYIPKNEVERIINQVLDEY